MYPSKYKRSPTIHLLIAAKTLIPRLWSSTKTPGLSDWFYRIDQVGEPEELVYTSNETMS